MTLEPKNLTSSHERSVIQSQKPQTSHWRRCRSRKAVPARAQVVAATLKAREMLTYSLSFSVSRLSSLTAWGAGNVDLYVFDQDGELVAFDNGADRQSHCAWLASANASYMVWVVNTERYPVTCSVALEAQ
jgi:hypothetical protein